MTSQYVEPGHSGAYRFVRQQDTEASKPYTSCRIVELMMQLLYGGIEFPNDTKFLEAFRRRTGVAEVANGVTQGTTAADVIFAASTMIPWVPVQFLAWSEDDLYSYLANHRGTISVAVDYSFLPDRLRMFSPNFRGRHQILIRMARTRGTREVLWVDCLGPRGHKGKWVKWSQFREILRKSGSASTVTGRFFVTSLDRGAALSTAIRQARDAYFPPATVKYQKGDPTWTFDPERGRLIAAKPVDKSGSATATETVRVTNYPTASPGGTFLILKDGPYKGRYIRVSDVQITEAPAPGDCQAAVDSATAPLIAEIKEWRAYQTAVDAIPNPDANGSPVPA